MLGGRSFGVPFALLGLLPIVGCRLPSPSGLLAPDLSAPHDLRELPSASVVVSSPDKTLTIVTADAKNDRWAAHFLADAIEETCGRRPDILVECKGQTCSRKEGLFIGDVSPNRGWTCALTNESAEAFRVVADGGCVRFLGRADYAVFDWCERALGLRYYCVDGKCAERRESVVVPAVDYSDRPVFECRKLGNLRQPWVRAGKSGGVHRGGVNVHAPSRWYADEKLKATHSDIFETGDTPMLCYGNPKTLDYYKLRIDRHIAGLEDSGGIVDTNRHVVTVCQWDAPIRCACEHCRPLYDSRLGRRGEASPIIWGRFLKNLAAWLARAHPDYSISFLPYLNTCEVPQNLKGKRRLKGGRRVNGLRSQRRARRLEGETEAEVCTMPGLALLKDEACRDREERILRDWQKVTGRKVLNWHYGCWPRERTSAPYLFGKTIRRHCAAMAETSCGAFVCGGDEDPSLTLSMYVWLRCLWNPDVDVEAIYDGFARRMFGPAERPMRAFIALQEDCWNRPWPDESCTARNVFEISYPPEDAARLVVLLREAYSLASKAGAEREKRRIVRYAAGMEPFLSESAALARRKGRKSVRPGEPVDMVAARSVPRPTPWARTTVVTAVEDDWLCMRVRCEDPAAKRMDFARMTEDFVWGNDSVFFVFDVDGELRSEAVFLTGKRRGALGSTLESKVSHDANGWTVEARLHLTEEQKRSGRILGNVCRWRVGDQRLPKAERVPGSRYEQSRLDTCFTYPDDDPSAFVEFRLAE